MLANHSKDREVLVQEEEAFVQPTTIGTDGYPVMRTKVQEHFAT